MNPRSPLQALAIDPGSSDHQKKNINLIASVKFLTRAGRAGWSGADFVGASSLNPFVSGKAKLDSAAYVTTIMEPHLDPLWNRRCEEYGRTVVVEDGVPGHKGHSKGYRELNGMGVIPWPPQSPDLNLIGALWGDRVRADLGKGERSGDTGAAVKAAWDSITEERLEELIRSMPAQLQAVIDAGHPTPY